MADPEEDWPQIDYVVEMGPDTCPRLKVQTQRSAIPLHPSAEQAARLGQALLAVSAVCQSASPPPEGTIIENCHFPVLRWGTGHSNTNGLPVLVLEIPGGAQLTFQFNQTTAQECGMSLARAGQAGPKL